MKKRCGHRFLTWKQHSWNPHTLKIALVYSQHSDNINKALSFLSTQQIPTIHGSCFGNVPSCCVALLQRIWKCCELTLFFITRLKKKKNTGCVIVTRAHWSVSLVLRCLAHGLLHICNHSIRTFQLNLPPPLAAANNKPPELQIVLPAAEFLPKPPPVALHTQIGICAAYT